MKRLDKVFSFDDFHDRIAPIIFIFSRKFGIYDLVVVYNYLNKAKSMNDLDIKIYMSKSQDLSFEKTNWHELRLYELPNWMGMADFR